MSSYLNYIMKVNGTEGKKSIKDIWIEEMADSLNEGMKEMLTKFRVEINSDKAKDVKIDGKLVKCLIKADAKDSNTTGTYMIRIRTEIGKIVEGSMIQFQNDKDYNNEDYLLMSKTEKINDFEQGYMTYCNQKIKINGTEIPCVMDNTTYGVKGLKDNGYFQELDAKMKCFVQANNYSTKLQEGIRLLVKNKSEHFNEEIETDKRWSAYQIIKFDHAVREGLYVMEMQLVPLSPLDDLVNGIAYNEDLKKENNVSSGEIYGEDAIYIGKSSEYEYSFKQNVQFEVSNDRVMIENINENICIIKGLKKGITTLKAKNKEVELAKINIMVGGE
ncbi:MAG: hypothetical protein ACRCX8_18965 [Sarcina sp.]